MQPQGMGDLPQNTPQQQYNQQRSQNQAQQRPLIYRAQCQPYTMPPQYNQQRSQHPQQQHQPYQQSINQPYSHQQSMYVSNQTLYHRAQQLPPYRPIMNQLYTHQQSMHQQSIYQETQNTQQFLNRTQAAPNNIRQNALVDNKSTQTSSPPMFESDALLNKIGQLKKENEALRKQNTGHLFTITKLETENAKLKGELKLTISQKKNGQNTDVVGVKREGFNLTKSLHGHSDFVSSVIYLPDKEQLVSASTDKTLKIWSLASGQCVQTLQGHSDAVNSVIYLPDKDQLVSASGDNTLKIWSLASGQCVKPCKDIVILYIL